LNENSDMFPAGPPKMSSCRQQKPVFGALVLSRCQDSSLDAFNREHYMVLVYCSTILMFQIIPFPASEQTRGKQRNRHPPLAERQGWMTVSRKFSSGKSRQGLGWNFPEASRNRSPHFLRIRQPAGFRRFSCCHHLAIKPYERLRESPCPTGDGTISEVSDGNKIDEDGSVVRTLSSRLLPQTSIAVSRGRWQ
jgi:hypothetical protein